MQNKLYLHIQISKGFANMYTIIYHINIRLPCINDDYNNLFNLITGLLCIYPGTSSVESDFSLVNSIQTE